MIGWSMPLVLDVVMDPLEFDVPPKMRFPPLVTFPFDMTLLAFDAAAL